MAVKPKWLTWVKPRTLKSAAEAGDLEAVKYHVGHGAKVNARTARGHFALGGAVIHGHEYVVAWLIEHGANVNLRSEYGWTPLYLAAWKGHAAIAGLLLRSGARLQARTLCGWNSPDGWTALHVAASEGHLAVVKLLVAAGARIHCKAGAGATPLDLARRGNHWHIAEYLGARRLSMAKVKPPKKAAPAALRWEPQRGCRTCRRKAAKARGCCDLCYLRWSALVRAGKTTWVRLERQGKALAPRPDRQRLWAAGRL